MSDNVKIRYWEDGDILIEADGWDCFIVNEALNPLINWLNLNRQDRMNEQSHTGHDKINGLEYWSVSGGLTITTSRDTVFLNSVQCQKFIRWLNDNREMLKIREVIV